METSNMGLCTRAMEQTSFVIGCALGETFAAGQWVSCQKGVDFPGEFPRPPMRYSCNNPRQRGQHRPFPRGLPFIAIARKGFACYNVIGHTPMMLWNL